MSPLLIPVKKANLQRGRFTLPRRLRLTSIHKEDILPLNQIATALKRIRVSCRIIPAEKGHIAVRRNKRIVHPERYELTINRNGVEIVSSTSTGAYYGIQTLIDLVHLEGRHLRFRRIEDWPTFNRRGVYHDCSRGKVPKVETVKALVERLAHWKINELQLYIENVFTFKKHPDIGKGFSPFKPRDLLEIQEHCKRHHVRFVPSLTSCGHFEKILMLPKYRDLGELPGFRGLPGGWSLNPGDPRSIQLLDDLYGEFLPLFEADDFNACLDEPWELGKGRSKRRAARIGVGRVYLEFVLKIRELCVKYGKRMNMWSDIVLKHPESIPLLPRDIVQLNWGYTSDSPRIPRTKELADAGMPLLCCPGTNTSRSHGSRLKTARENIAAFAAAALGNGAEGILNTDWGDGGHRNMLGVSLYGFSLGAAHSWNTESVDTKRHLRNFTFHTFNDEKGGLSNALSVLGSNISGKWAYSSLLEGLKESVSLARGICKLPVPKRDAPKTRQIVSRIEALKKVRLPRADKTLDKFEQIALEEFALATHMDRLAFERMQLRRIVRAGKTLSAKRLRAHADAMLNIAHEFERLWRLRNRPSRLIDNLAGFSAAAHEARSLIPTRNY